MTYVHSIHQHEEKYSKAEGEARHIEKEYTRNGRKRMKDGGMKEEERQKLREGGR